MLKPISKVLKNLFIACLIVSVLNILSIKNILAQSKDFINKSLFDTSISPGDNFYLYVNGGWFKQLKQLNSESKSWFDNAQNEAQNKLGVLLKNLSANTYSIGSTEQKVSDFIKSAMDSNKIDKISFTPTLPFLSKIDSAKNFQQLMVVVGQLYKEGGGKVLGFDVRPDVKNSKKYIPYFEQAGKTLPFIDNEVYTKNDSSSKAFRKILSELAVSYFKTIGESEETSIKNAYYVIDIEKKLASSFRSASQLRDQHINYNKISVADAAKKYPNIGWNRLLQMMDIKTDSINIAHPPYYKALNDLLESEPLEAWKAKLKFDYLYKNSWYLSTEFIKPRQKFLNAYRGAVFGSRDYSYVVMELLRDLVTQLYIKEYVNPGAKKRLDSIVNNVQVTFADRITKLDWMSSFTKKAALNKLSNVIKNIGYPTSWSSYSVVNINKENFFFNVIAILKHNYKQLISKVGKPVNRSEWFSSPLQGGAYYRWTENSITIPAAMMYLPYFDLNADDAINYGGVGTVIAHEMLHGFDDVGKQYDGEGNLKNWWKQEDDSLFKRKTEKIINQYEQYIIYDSLNINGKLTLGENIADLGGVIVAYEAFKKTKQGRSNNKINDLTPDQRFFISYAIKHRNYEKITSDFVSKFKTLSKSSLHAPFELRVNAPLSNYEPFYRAFNVNDHNKLYKKNENRVVVW